MSMIKAVLFDLDGTLLDTVLDLTLALNRLRDEYQLPPMIIDDIRPFAGKGAKKILQQSFDMDENGADFEDKLKRYLQLYGECLVETTQFFPGVESLLHYLCRHEIPWGIVTNKRESFTMAICNYFTALQQAGCIVCGDTLPFQKPHPAPLFHACQLLNFSPNECVFIGDSLTDMVAGRHANMKSYAVSYGYIPYGDDINQWPADGIIHHPSGIIDLFQGVNPWN